MRITKTLSIAAFGTALALGACSGAEDGEAGETSETAEEEAEAEAHDASSYAVDETGRFDNELGEGGMAGLNEMLAAHRAEDGHDIHIRIAAGERGTDANPAATSAIGETNANAMIYVDVRNQAVVIVGDGIDEAESQAISADMISAFDEENFESGFAAGVEATSEAIEN